MSNLRLAQIPFQTIFQKHSSDDLEVTDGKKKLAKIVVECRKEGIVNYVPPEFLKNDKKDLTNLEWEKCKLVLVKCAGGYMLEFHSLDKTPKTHSGIFCYLIHEARETTALEMPDKENTFVLKADGGREYLIEAKDAMDMKSWIATVRFCMKSGQPLNQASSSQFDDSSLSILPNTSTGILQVPTLDAPTPPNTSLNNIISSSNNNNNISLNNNQLASSSSPLSSAPQQQQPQPQPEVPPRRPDASGQFPLDEEDLEHESDLTAQMNEYPW